MKRVATVITCPRRFAEYETFQRQYRGLGFRYPCYTFQTREALDTPYANNNLNARAALAFALRHLDPDGWLLYLEDDTELHPDLPAHVERLIELSGRFPVAAWYLCNRRNRRIRQFQMAGYTVNELIVPKAKGKRQKSEVRIGNPGYDGPDGAHGLLLHQSCLGPILDRHWDDVSDHCIFRGLCGYGEREDHHEEHEGHEGNGTADGRGWTRMKENSSLITHHSSLFLQVVDPVLVKHTGVRSTYCPDRIKELETAEIEPQETVYG